ncbi:RluA family pseudouridine synthase [Sporosarcina pasteurii]|uniref:Pseudouridine synthase n=1 Tax=Sporosarcina pasteurii TaxID=1474 RepID=A0A380BFW8_SPOPA|nr:RluA family pseudouridine synthase [Sporosarcina pasteurii]MDS9470386.1 RluA family pseudouridine synthase [Sporosarcina pasteurii]SUI99944.1 Ribosomal large subunit pseudouridine synthase D [Sporosarcina pasteurii]
MRSLKTMVKLNTKRFHLEFIVQEDGKLLREFLAEKDISKRTLTAVKYDGGQLLVNGVERDVRVPLAIGDTVEVFFPPEKLSDGLLVEEGELDIIYEDEAILLLNKPAGKSTIPSLNHQFGTIANYVAGKFMREHIPSTVHIVTRLDYNTSGLLCIAKNRHIHHLFGKQMMSSTFKREYEAIVEGYVAKDDILINEPIGRKEGSIIERIVRDDGQEARTNVQVIDRFEKNGKPFTQVALSLQTGRTHQIRTHMKWLGHPLAGDDLYGGKRCVINRQALHCTTLSFYHPVSGKEKVFVSEVPEDMKKMLMGKM